MTVANDLAVRRGLRGNLSGALRLYAFDILGLEIGARNFEIVMGLEVHPKLWTITKVKAEAECSVCGNASTIVDDLGNAVWQNANRFC